MTPEVKARQKFSCPACGGEAHWNPGKQALVCPFCGTTFPGDDTPAAPGDATITEHDLVAALRGIPDDQRGWVPFASRRALRLHRRVPFDAVVSTAGPYSAHLIGRALARSERVPWVADFRDEWTTNPYLVHRYPTAWHRRLNRRLEASVLREMSQDADMEVAPFTTMENDPRVTRVGSFLRRTRLDGSLSSGRC